MDIKKQGLTSASHSEFALEVLRQIAPSAFTEVRGADGELTHKVDFDILRELLGDAIADTDEDRFGFHWVGKQAAKRAAAEPTRQTLRPIVEDSVDWNNTENLYIEGDNLEVLKLLQRAYLGKVKMIYIDPPYNTGNDLVYQDDFAMSSEEMDEAMGNLNEEGYRLRKNLDSNPRYHSDWCSMIYSRLLVARTLLANDGVIFISIDDNEVHHLRKICDEVFGASNFVAEVSWHRNYASANDAKTFSNVLDYIIIYRKGEEFKRNLLPRTEKQNHLYKYDSNDGKGRWRSDNLSVRTYSAAYDFPIINPNTGVSYTPPKGRSWMTNKETIKLWIDEGRIFFGQKGDGAPQLKRYLSEVQDGVVPITYWSYDECGHNDEARKEIKVLFDGQPPFDSPKPTRLLLQALQIGTDKDSLILDFFSGSATTAHAVMQLNAEDGGQRKYICVQLPEKTPEGSDARKAGYKTICEIGKERIRRAGKIIIGKMDDTLGKLYQEMYDSCGGAIESPHPSAITYFLKNATGEQVTKFQETSAAFNKMKMRRDTLDTGFRVLRIDSSNMEEVYFEPAAISQANLFAQVDSVKGDRTELDLLFGCMVDWGVELSYPLRREEVAGKHLHIVNEGALVACFDEEINLDAIRHIASMKPLRVIFRESCFATDADKLNVYEQFKQLCGWSDDEAYKRIHVI